MTLFLFTIPLTGKRFIQITHNSHPVPIYQSLREAKTRRLSLPDRVNAAFPDSPEPAALASDKKIPPVLKIGVDKTHSFLYNEEVVRGVAQFGRALGSGPRGRRFKSSHSDHVVASFVSLATTFLCVASKSHLSLTPLLLLSKSNPLRWASIW